MVAVNLRCKKNATIYLSRLMLVYFRFNLAQACLRSGLAGLVGRAEKDQMTSALKQSRKLDLQNILNKVASIYT